MLACLAAAQPPAKPYARGIVLVDLRVNDAPGWALIDTGSPFTYVDSSLRDELCGPQEASSKTPPAKTAEAKLWIGGKLTVKQTVRFLDLQPFNDSSAKRPLIAVIGRDLLSGYALGVDMRRGRLRLWKGGKVDADTVKRWGDGAAVIAHGDDDSVGRSAYRRSAPCADVDPGVHAVSLQNRVITAPEATRERSRRRFEEATRERHEAT